MSAERKPRVGEAWTSTRTGRTYACVVDAPDADGYVVWLAENGRYAFFPSGAMMPPLPQPPEWLAAAWVNVHPGGSFSVPYLAASTADEAASPNRIGRVSLTGQWVPCDGKRVLA